MESKINFASGPLSLEGLINPLSGGEGVVICHPHTLYGGEMTNPVVETIAQTFNRRGFTSLRFNFRGAGHSQGEFDNGLAEQEDVLAAIRELSTRGIRKTHLAGYSFGAWVNSRITSLPPEVEATIMVAPPVAFLDYQNIGAQPLLKMVITGEEDEFAPPRLVREHLGGWNADAALAVLDNTDHFFYGSFHLLAEELTGMLANAVT